MTLDTVVAAHHGGASPEEIVDRYPSLSLAVVYAAIGYYLYHQPAVDRYLRERERQAATVRRKNEARFNPGGARERLLARRTVRGC